MATRFDPRVSTQTRFDPHAFRPTRVSTQARFDPRVSTRTRFDPHAFRPTRVSTQARSTHAVRPAPFDPRLPCESAFNLTGRHHFHNVEDQVKHPNELPWYVVSYLANHPKNSRGAIIFIMLSRMLSTLKNYLGMLSPTLAITLKIHGAPSFS